MRKIGEMDDQGVAQRFGDYLLTEGIRNEIAPGDGGQREVWIADEDQAEQARARLAEFTADPDNARYRDAERRADAVRAAEAKADARTRTRYIDGLAHLSLRPPDRIGPLTMALILVCVTISVLSFMGRNNAFLQHLYITKYQVVGDSILFFPSLPEIMHGQVWRLWTPAFIHFGVLHLVFDMLWLFNLGTMIERRQKTWVLALLVLVIAPLSNLAQYAASGPAFGGMSGVVYGLLGYVWLRARFDPDCGLYLPHDVVVMMIVWFFLCLFGIIPGVANAAHGVGFGVGIVWGYVSSGRLSIVWNRLKRR